MRTFCGRNESRRKLQVWISEFGNFISTVHACSHEGYVLQGNVAVVNSCGAVTRHNFRVSVDKRQKDKKTLFENDSPDSTRSQDSLAGLRAARCALG